MKKSILVLAASALITGAVITSCNTPAKKVENAQNEVNEANEKLDQANEEYLADIESYRKETADKIAANDRSIAEFNARIRREKMDAKADYKKKMDDYKAEGKENWEKFKAEFSHDMEEIGKAFKDLTVKNVK